MGGFGFDPDTNTLYGADATADALYAIDAVSGSATLLGPLGIDRASDLFVLPGRVAFGVGNGTCCQKLYAVDLATGSFTALGISLAGSAAGLASPTGTACSVAIAPTSLPSGLEGAPYSRALTASGGSGGGYDFAIDFGTLPAGIALTQSGGGALVAGEPYESGSFPLGIRVTDASGCSVVQPYDLVVDACPVSIMPSTLPKGSQGTPYSQTITASGGTPPYTFTLLAGALPVGLTLSSTGVLSGTPDVPGTFAFVITARDALCASSRDYALTIDGSGTAEDIIVGEGLGPPNPNRIRVFKQSGTATKVDFYAYGAGAWGNNVAGGNIGGLATGQIISGPGPGAVFGPQVRAFLSDGSGMGKVNFYAYGTLKYGVNVSGKEVDGDLFSEILTGAGPGEIFGPHVRGFNYDASSIQAITRISFFAYSTLKNGVNVEGGSMDGDPFDELLTGPGPGFIFAPQVRGFNYDGAALTAIGKINFVALPEPHYGVNVAGGDVDGDGVSEVACAPGPGPTVDFPPRFLGFDVEVGVSALPGFDVALPLPTAYGGRIGAGDVTGSGSAELLAAAGRDPAAPSRLFPYDYVAGALSPLLTFEAFPGTSYGVNPVSGPLGL